ncbi:hypothetical protein ACAF76_008810 [Brevibacillus sp. TJ4]|uniref:hypothetical protein n=1 Tax=Brevibacillus sp. TJ4 TaxID=3234853 RepID=UPI0037D3DA38
MLGTIWINTGLALLSFVVTFGTALVSNVWLVSLERAVIAFVVFFLAAFPIRWILGVVTQTPAAPDVEGHNDTAEAGNEAREADMNVQQSDEAEPFTPLSFSKVDTTHPTEDPTTVAEVIRRLTDE